MEQIIGNRSVKNYIDEGEEMVRTINTLWESSNGEFIEEQIQLLA